MFSNGREIPASRSGYELEDDVRQVLVFEGPPGPSRCRWRRWFAIFTSLDQAITDPQSNAEAAVRRCPSRARPGAPSPGLGRALGVLRRAVPLRPEVELLLRFHIAHILQVCSPYTADLDAGVPARGLNGEAYRGHVFWDELYIYPFLNHRLPRSRVGCSSTVTAGWVRRGRLRRTLGIAVACTPAERKRWERGDADGPPEPCLGALGARSEPPAAPRQRGDLL